MAEERTDRERLKAIEMAVGQIEKQFGKGSIMRLGQRGPIQPIPAISTGSISLDHALGVGGVPRGRVVEIFGPESSGKTTLALQVDRRRRRRPAAWPPSWTPSTRSTRIRAEAGRRSRQPARVAARQRRAGARDCRGAGALGRRGRRGRRLGRRARAPGGDRRRDGRRPGGPAGPPRCRRRCASSPASSRSRRPA